MEFAAFYMTKIYEVLFRYLRNEKCELTRTGKKQTIRKMCEIPECNRAIQEVPFSKLGIGKRDKMIYPIVIMCLRMKWFDVLIG